MDRRLKEHLETKITTELKLQESSVAHTDEQLNYAAKELGISDTEYRLNWIPLGGYVKMLGQDDLRPGAIENDPRAYNNKSIRSRMFIVSAGVIMNVILAAIGFMIVFRLGYPVPPPIVGGIQSQSPAAMAVRDDGSRLALQPGDQILTYDGKDTSGDFGKIILDVALTEEGATVPIRVKHIDGSEETLHVTPAHLGGDPKGLLAMGMFTPTVLRGPDVSVRNQWDENELKKTQLPDFLTIAPGDVITQVNGQDVQPDEFWKLSAALAASGGKPVDLTVRSAKGEISHRPVQPHFAELFGKEGLNFLGMEPRVRVTGLNEKSPAVDKLRPGDIIEDISVGSDHVAHPTSSQLTATISQAGAKGQTINMTVLSLGEDKPHEVKNLTPNVRLEGGKIGLYIGLGYDPDHLVISQVHRDSSAYGKIPDGATLLAIDGKPVSNWFQVRDTIDAAKAGDTLALTFKPEGAEDQPQTSQLTLSKADVDASRTITVMNNLPLEPMPGNKQSNSPVVDLKWGLVETRDLILQFYLTLQRMTTGAVSPRNAMGPVGMFAAGAQMASRGPKWLIWFLSIISANLAVVNFLPIPIVDGGLFTMLILEKIQGKPLSQDTQKIVQLVGLVLILGVFLLVTYQDIARLAGF
jgi:regulator of sigma E protease